MGRTMLALALAWLLCSCAFGPTTNVSGPVLPGLSGDDAGVTIGLLADSQFQSPRTKSKVWLYHGALEDDLIEVTLRPPALDWAARALLREQLKRLAARGVKAIFYLGDGANNGCTDEFAAGYAAQGARPVVGRNAQGVLAVLAEFRDTARIPIFYVIGNHDFLGAGNTSQPAIRAALCGDDNPPLTKYEVIELVDRFNRGNGTVGADWSYWSNNSVLPRGLSMRALCGDEPAGQQRRWGCYLAGRVAYQAPGAKLELLLLDTNDFVGVGRSSAAGKEFEGLRGAMSYGSNPDLPDVPSQTTLLSERGDARDVLRIALSHYNVGALRAPFGLSRQSQRFADLFTRPDTRTKTHAGGYVITAHTHTRRYRVTGRRFDHLCAEATVPCSKRAGMSVQELNIGSTTDYSNYATVAQIVPDGPGPGTIRYAAERFDETACLAVFDRLATFPFAPVLGKSDGLAAIGLDQRHRRNYRDFDPKTRAAIYANLDAFAGSDDAAAACVGSYAARLEAGRLSPTR